MNKPIRRRADSNRCLSGESGPRRTQSGLTALVAVVVALLLPATSTAATPPRPDNPNGTAGRAVQAYEYDTLSRNGKLVWRCRVPVTGRRVCRIVGATS